MFKKEYLLVYSCNFESGKTVKGSIDLKCKSINSLKSLHKMKNKVEEYLKENWDFETEELKNIIILNLIKLR